MNEGHYRGHIILTPNTIWALSPRHYKLLTLGPRALRAHSPSGYTLLDVSAYPALPQA